MSGSSSVLAWSSALEDFALFRTLSSEQRLKTLNAMVRQDLVRGQMLVAQGGPSDSLFLVLHGALAVRKTGYLEPIAELRAGDLQAHRGRDGHAQRQRHVQGEPERAQLGGRVGAPGPQLRRQVQRRFLGTRHGFGRPDERRLQPLFELLKLGVDKNPKSLKCARCRVLARLAGFDRASERHFCH